MKRPQWEGRWTVSSSGCWLWGGGTGKSGYGVAWWQGRQVQAHRAVYELMVGPIPDGLELDHVRARGCTSRLCVNPAHLEPVDRKTQEARKPGRAPGDASRWGKYRAELQKKRS